MRYVPASPTTGTASRLVQRLQLVHQVPGRAALQQLLLPQHCTCHAAATGNTPSSRDLRQPQVVCLLYTPVDAGLHDERSCPCQTGNSCGNYCRLAMSDVVHFIRHASKWDPSEQPVRLSP
jgi:hypothetical protein